MAGDENRLARERERERERDQDQDQDQAQSLTAGKVACSLDLLGHVIGLDEAWNLLCNPHSAVLQRLAGRELVEVDDLESGKN